MPAIGVARPTRVGDVVQFETYSEYGYCRKIIRAVTPAVDYTIGQVVKPDGAVWATGQTFGGIFLGTWDGKNVAVAGTAVDIVVLYRGVAGVGNGYLKPAATAAVFKEMSGLIDAAGIKILEQPVNAMNTTTPASVGVEIPTV